MIANYLIIGAQLPEGSKGNTGGILIATEGLMAFADENDLDVDLFNVYSPSFPAPPIWKKAWRLIFRTIDLYRLAKQNRYKGALVFCSSGLGFFERILMVLVLKRFRIKTVLYMVSGHFKDQVEDSKIFNFLARHLLKLPDNIGIQGPSWVDFYHKLNIDNSKIKILRNWLPLAMHGKTTSKTIISSPQDIKFLYVGWIVKPKGIFELLDAIKASPLLRSCHFLFVGGGDKTEEVKTLIVENDLQNITTTGWVEPEQVVEEMKKSHVLVFPSHAEGFPNVIVEAMSQSLVMVATKVGAIPDAIEEGANGYLVEAKNAFDLQEKLEKVAKEFVKIPGQGQHSLKIMQRDYSYAKNCKEIFDLLDS